jgi:hypothetical protein
MPIRKILCLKKASFSGVFHIALAGKKRIKPAGQEVTAYATGV